MDSTLLADFDKYDSGTQKEVTTYSGLLGLAIGGQKQVNVDSRPGFVYVRLRDNLSEVLQAHNDKVSPIYDFPVVIQRNGNRWVVVGKDTNRYDTWMTSAPFLPKHGNQHSFDRDLGTGGDPVFVYPDQFMPLLVYPSGTYGASMLLIAPYVLRREDDFIYVGNTGTQNLLSYKPTDNQAILGLITLNTDSGNPEVLIASGTPIAGGITGTAGILPYLPFPSSTQEPLYAFRLVSGTTSVNWPNLYNIRQFIGGIGSASTGTSSQSFITGSVPFASSPGQLTEDNANLFWNDSLDQLHIGPRGLTETQFTDFPLVVASKSQNQAIAVSAFAYGTGTAGSPSPTFLGIRQRGSIASPAPLKSGDALTTLGVLAYDGQNWVSPARIRLYANGDFITGAYYPTRMDFDLTPSGSSTRRTQFQIYGNSVNQPTGSTYNIGGIPHVHSAGDVTGLTPINGWISASWASPTRTSDTVFTVAEDVTGVIEKGTKLKLTDTTTKYFVVLSAVYSAGVTTITTIASTNYALAGNPSAIYYSNISNPFGFPDWFDYTGTPAANGSMTVTAYTIDNAKWRVSGKSLYFKHRISGITLAGTASTVVNFPAPITPTIAGVFVSTIIDTSTTVARGILGTTLQHARADGANWTLGVNRLIQGDGSFPL